MKNLKKLKDDELIFFIKLQDREAMNVLLERYRVKAEILVKSILVRFKDTGIELSSLINVALGVINKAVITFRFHEGAKFSSYWNCLARQEVMDYLYKNSYKGKSSTFEGISLDSELEISDDTLYLKDSIGEEDFTNSNAFIFNQFLGIITDSKNKLSKLEQEIFVDYLNGKTMEEIMENFCISKNKYYRSVKKAKDVLQKYYKE